MEDARRGQKAAYWAAYYRQNREELNQRRYATPESRAALNQRRKEWGHANPERHSEIVLAALERYRLKCHGLTAEQYDRMLALQENRCAICKSPNAYRKIGNQGRKPTKGWATTKRAGTFAKWCIDHDHRTGQVRGLLCSTCNIALGAAKDDVRLLRAMIEYLSRR
jgi:hypothetical protein